MCIYIHKHTYVLLTVRPKVSLLKMSLSRTDF